MGNSLFDQLKKTGLVDERRAKKVKKEKYRKTRQQRQAGTADQTTLLAQQAREQKAERARKLNQQRKEEAERKALAAQIRQLIETNRITGHDGEIAYRFTDANVVRQIHVTTELQRQLSCGRLAIVKLGERYEMVPSSVAEKIRERDAACVILCNRGPTDSKPQEDDPYADYRIPDDLMW